MLKINHLNLTIEGKKILADINLNISSGEIHVLMGPNGSGKTSLALTLMGHPKYQCKMQSAKCKISVDTIDITSLSPDKRARAGLFLSFQNPPAIEGVTVRQICPGIEGSHPSIDLKPELLERALNVGFSGGEKKKLELIQMLALQPKYAILDEIDSGLDIDSLKTVFQMLNNVTLPRRQAGMQQFNHKLGILLITHNPRIFKYLIPNYIHIIKAGKIVKSGGKELIHKLEKEGYAAFH